MMILQAADRYRVLLIFNTTIACIAKSGRVNCTIQPDSIANEFFAGMIGRNSRSLAIQFTQHGCIFSISLLDNSTCLPPNRHSGFPAGEDRNLPDSGT